MLPFQKILAVKNQHHIFLSKHHHHFFQSMAFFS